MKRGLWLCLAVVVIAACTGPKGDPGPQGPEGPQGPTGAQGAQGPALVLSTAAGLSGNGTAASPLGIANGGVTAAHLAGPARIYSRLMTPRWLQANANIHSARVATVTNTEISFAAAGAGNTYTRLLTVPLLPASTLDPSASYLVRIVVNQVVASADNDPLFGVSDGTNYIALEKLDANNTTSAAAAISGTYGNNLTSIVSVNLGGPGQNAENFEFLLRLGPISGSNTPVFFASRVGTVAGRHQMDSPINRTAELSFAVFANDDAELYTFQSFEVTIDREG